jgi:glycerate 2-kinase
MPSPERATRPGTGALNDPRAFLASLFDAAVSAADPDAVLPFYLPPRPRGRTVVVGAGKGAAQMARAFERAFLGRGDGPLEGIVVTRYGFAVPCERIEVIEAAHPVPDAAGLAASQRLLDAVSGLSADDLVMALVSGGGSALLPAPAGDLTLDDEIAVNRALLSSGAPISAMNVVRKHVSRIKGGRLALAAAPARVVTLVVSDIPGDLAAHVASGPTVADGSTRQDALGVIAHYGLDLPARVLAHLASPAADAPQPEAPEFAGNRHHVIASARLSLEAAKSAAEAAGIEAVILSDAIEGEARDAGLFHAAIAREVALRDRPFARPVVLISGGETTVTLKQFRSSPHRSTAPGSCSDALPDGEPASTSPGSALRGSGKGGRNTEFLLGLARGIDGLDGITALAADTDGIDGSEDNAGAFADTTSVERMRRAGIDAAAALAANDAWSAFNAVGDLFVTGPTGTNVNDFRAILIA